MLSINSNALAPLPPGVTAALAAGLTVVAVPSHITQHTDLSAAHLSVPTLEHLDLPTLTDLLPA
jgi:beta-phosphoglucomutase-like phosphatase (HAD superfamily)